MNTRTIELHGFKVDVCNFGYSSYYYPHFNMNMEFKVSSKGFRELSHYLRYVKWIDKTMPLPSYLNIDIFGSIFNQYSL